MSCIDKIAHMITEDPDVICEARMLYVSTPYFKVKKYTMRNGLKAGTYVSDRTGIKRWFSWMAIKVEDFASGQYANNSESNWRMPGIPYDEEDRGLQMFNKGYFPVVLRFSSQMADEKPDKFGTDHPHSYMHEPQGNDRSGRGFYRWTRDARKSRAYILKRPIAPEHIEIYNGENWVPLATHTIHVDVPGYIDELEKEEPALLARQASGEHFDAGRSWTFLFQPPD